MLAAPTRYSRRGLTIICALALILYLYLSTWTKPLARQSAHTSSSQDLACHKLPGAHNVFVVIKTGATELYEKLPPQLATLLRCAPNYIVVGDVEVDVGQTHVHDVLAQYGEDIKARESEFALYRTISEFNEHKRGFHELKDDYDAWVLDKWKNIPSALMAYDRMPTAKWFLFIDADTALLWSNVLLWVQGLNPLQPFYTGSRNYIGWSVFAHGGSGILVSNAALARLNSSKSPEQLEDWASYTAGSCCGDEVLGKAFRDVGVNLTESFPLIQGETMSSLDWTSRHFCAPAMTWHHMSSAEINTLWNFEQNWIHEKGWGTPILFKDIFDYFVLPHLAEDKDEWDNLSQEWIYSPDSVSPDWLEIEQQSFLSFEHCQWACKYTEGCVQFVYSENKCQMDSKIRLGRSDANKENKSRSGWFLDRVDEFRESQSPCLPNWELVQ